MITPEVFDPRLAEADVQREHVAGALARLLDDSIRWDRTMWGGRSTGMTSWINGTFRLDHNALWNRPTNVTMYAFDGKQGGTYDALTMVSHFVTHAPAAEIHSKRLDYVGPEVPVGFTVEQSFDDQLEPTSTAVSPLPAPGLWFPHRRGIHLAVPIMNRLVEEFSVEQYGQPSLADFLPA